MLEALAPTATRDRRLTAKVTAGGLALALLAVLAAALVFRFVEGERQRDLRAWQVRLGLVADGRTAAVRDWIERQVAAVAGLAENTSLQIYMTEWAAAGGDPAKVTEAAAQAGYLRNLLIVSAERAGFAAPPIGPSVGANIQRQGIAGLALLDAEARVLVATPNMPAVEGRLKTFVLGAPAGERAIEDLYLGPGARPSMAFLAPVVPVQADPGSRQIGWMIGVKDVAAELFPLLNRPPVPEKTAETVLVRHAGAVVEYLSPLNDGTGALGKRLAANTPGLAEAFALASPGDFARRRDHRDVEVLATGRAVGLVPWTLVHKVDAAEALADSETRLDRLLIILLLAVGGATALVVAVWRHGASRRAGEAASRFEALAHRFASQGRLLKLVTDSQPASMFIADAEGRVRFANRVLGERTGVAPEELVGKTLASVFGPAAAMGYEKLNREAIEKQKIQPSISREGEGDGLSVLRAEHIPLPVLPAEPAAVLVVEADITAEVGERERRERTLRHLVRTLVAMVDRRDPFAAHHSQRVASVARWIAEEMGLERVEIETAETAGNLLNLGKLLVAPELLTRSGGLSEDEKRQIRSSLQAGADLLEGIEFDGPVVATLRQAQERWDGSGAKGLKAEAILPMARAVAVANAFVALMSPRAHRPGVALERAIEALWREAGTAFDRRAVAALVNHLDNRGGRERWTELGEGAPTAS
ncbi:MAG: HD-GYP domain-containing protein [Pseudomonadota bacterium]